VRGLRPWWLALAVSLLLHAVLIGGLAPWLPSWQAPADEAPFDVQLALPPVPSAAPKPSSAPRVARAQRPAAAPPPAPEPVAEPPAEPAAEAGAPAAPLEPAAEAVAPAAPAADAEPRVQPPVEAAAAPPLNALPPRLQLRYEVRYGLAAGEQTVVWVNEGERYTLTSVAAATGLAGVFYRGRFAQTSRGRITPAGLVPEEFWDQRGDKRSHARFDAAAGTVTYFPAQGAPRHFSHAGTIQDALSLIFQLALTAPPAGGSTYAVFNGRKLREYRYEVRGEVVLDTALGPLRTLHLARAGGAGGVELWLAIDRDYLPVRLLRVEESGPAGELNLLAVGVPQ
jgi:hypothetical protein